MPFLTWPFPTSDSEEVASGFFLNLKNKQKEPCQRVYHEIFDLFNLTKRKEVRKLEKELIRLYIFHTVSRISIT